MRKLLLALSAFALVLGACAQGGAPASVGVPAVGRAEGGSAVAVDAKAPAAAPAAPQAGIPVVVVTADRNLILTAKIDMRTKDPWATSQAVQELASRLGGDVLSVNESGSGDNRNASLTVRVPSRSFQEAIRQIRAYEGEVVTSSVSGQDVTDQFVDLQARLAAKQAEEQRYLALVPNAKTIDEILRVDAALGSVRVQIEQLTGQINAIKNKTDFSTISMTISPLTIVPTPEPARAWDPAKTVARAVGALAAMLQVFGDLAIWLVVFGWIPLLGLGALLIVTRPRRSAAHTPTA